ncbi:HNH endonuclease [Cereibacter sphaeroides]|uniref:RNA-guided endonuclease IscB n=2 Tax=Cereibacter sphaeroides TaxID=1063 RepID=UPI001F1B47A1|nr:RNA-guided endonuclease IscB [Cereibacter sphaeroides]MCE6959578.1 HNH endonuclease [Cereibacter sphaeroides]MCE6974562.1 HNH endonuclease [Cereibacter sphaeroides]
MTVFVLDKRHQPLMPCSDARARQMLRDGKAVVHRQYPFTIRLRHRVGGDLQPVEVRLDPGSRTTGIALVRKPVPGREGPDTVLFLGELEHRGSEIRNDLTARAARRRNRRSRLRARPARFSFRTKPEGWLAPSLRHRVLTTICWVDRLSRLAPVTSAAQELVRFDTQAMQNPEISGVEYQQGALAGYEVREYLLEKGGRCCAYCDARNVPLQIDHVRPRAHGGSNRVSNLVLACGPCNQAKGGQPVETFLARKPKRLAKILAGLQRPLRDAAAVNSTRNALFTALRKRFPEATGWSGGRTKWNRSRLGIPKTHALDAVCVGEVEAVVRWSETPVLQIRATGRGGHQRVMSKPCGFPKRDAKDPRQVAIKTRRFTAPDGRSVRTGDHVAARLWKQRNKLVYGRIQIRANGCFALDYGSGSVGSLPHRFVRTVQRADGYHYFHKAKAT